ncbi:hypothetical protein GF342_00995 [Candidatus Woesearchaeota archaeon]|nr:hypothetical protein [Candidatus Woesearchaeota archaeon]
MTVQTSKERVQDFLSCLEAEAKHAIMSLQGILFFGSYTREKEFSDIDIVPVLYSIAENNAHLRDKTEADRARLEYFLYEGQTTWDLPALHIHGYFGLLASKDQEDQFERQVQRFYDYFTSLNRQSRSYREEIGIEKPPRDFRFSPEHTIWIDRTPLDKERIQELLKRINEAYAQEVARYY